MTIEQALTVLDAHLVAADAALTTPCLDVARGLPTGGRQVRYYWGGEIEPPRMGGNRSLTGDIVGQRFIIAALWPLGSLLPDVVTALDIEMQALAAQVRTRLDADSTLGGYVMDIDLSYGEPDIVTISNARHVALLWDLDLAYLDYTLGQ